MDLEGKKILLTGGTGFIGRHVVTKLLSEGATVFCLTRQNRPTSQRNLVYLQCDLRELNSPVQKRRLQAKIGKTDACVYLAASIPLASKGKEDMVTAKQNNLDPFLFFLDTFGKSTKKIVFASTIDIYGIPSETNFTEETAVQPQSTYAIAKYCCEKYLEYYCAINNQAYTILRLSQVYGPNEPRVRVTSFIIEAAKKNKPFNLIGSGLDKRRFLYVKDAALAICEAITYPQNDVFNIAGREDTSILKIIATIEHLTKRKLIVQQSQSDKKPVDILPSGEKAAKKLGFTPLFSYEEGIREIIREEIRPNKNEKLTKK